MRIDFRLKDINGLIIKVLICAILWYREFIQAFVQIQGFLIISGSLLTLAVIVDNYSERGNRTLKKLPAEIYLILLYCVGTFVMGFFYSPKLAQHISWGTNVVEFALIMVFVCYYGTTRGSFDFITWNYALITVILSIIFLSSPVLVSNEAMRYSISEEVNPNAFAVTLSIGIWSILGLVSRKKISLMIGTVLCVPIIMSTVMTASKKGFISMGLVVLLWLFFVFIPLSERKDSLKKLKRMGITLVLCAVLVFLLYKYVMDSALLYRFKILGQDESTLARINFYSNGWNIIKKSPIFGHGFAGFSYFFKGYYSHSTFIEVVASGGIPLAVIYLFSYLMIAKKLLFQKRLLRQTGNFADNRVQIRMQTIMFIILIVNAFTVIHIYDLTSQMMFGMTIATISAGYLNKNRESKD